MEDYSKLYLKLYDYLVEIRARGKLPFIAWVAILVPGINIFSLWLIGKIIQTSKNEYVGKRTDKRPVNLIYNFYQALPDPKHRYSILKTVSLARFILDKEFCYSMRMSGGIFLQDKKYLLDTLNDYRGSHFEKTYHHYQMFVLFFLWKHDAITKLLPSAIEKRASFELDEYNVSLTIPLSLGLSDEPMLSAYYYLAYFYEDEFDQIENCSQLKSSYPQIILRHLQQEPEFKLIEDYCQDKTKKAAIFFLSQNIAVGHAVQDAYCFLSLYKEKYDRLFFVGRPISSYSDACRAGLKIIQQYGTYVEVSDPFLIELNWMNHGIHHAGNITLHLENHWSLLRDMVLQHHDVGEAYKYDQFKLELTKEINRKGKEFCKERGIKLSERPIICLHIREHTYHSNKVQAHRNATVDNYVAAIEYLLSQGYQVLRLGDEQMTPLGVSNPFYRELPFEESYDADLNVFFVSSAEFMIGCQSGPCAYARTMDVPLLTLNGIYDFAHMPATYEMGCAKRLYRWVNGHKVYIEEDEILKEGYFLLVNAFQFDEAGIQFEELSSKEIVYAVQDMISWINVDGLSMNSFDQEFHELAMQVHHRLSIEAPENLRIAKFFSYSASNYRQSPTVLGYRKRLT